jgi:hypothetical protein
MGFPPPGSRWITRSLDQAGGNRLTTYTVLEPGSFQGRPGFRVSDDIGVQFFERAGRNWFATVVREKERSGATPHHGTFAWPLEVGKGWSSVYQYRDNLRNLRFNRVEAAWRVAAEEDVSVPAGTFKALRLEGGNISNAWTLWYAPAVRLVVRIHDASQPSLGPRLATSRSEGIATAAGNPSHMMWATNGIDGALQGGPAPEALEAYRRR